MDWEGQHTGLGHCIGVVGMESQDTAFGEAQQALMEFGSVSRSTLRVLLNK